MTVLILTLLSFVLPLWAQGIKWDHKIPNHQLAPECFVTGKSVSYLVSYTFYSGTEFLRSYDIATGELQFFKNGTGPAYNGIQLPSASPDDEVYFIIYSCVNEWSGYPPLCVGAVDGSGNIVQHYDMGLTGNGGNLVPVDGNSFIFVVQADANIGNDILKFNVGSNHEITLVWRHRASDLTKRTQLSFPHSDFLPTRPSPQNKAELGSSRQLVTRTSEEASSPFYLDIQYYGLMALRMSNGTVAWKNDNLGAGILSSAVSSDGLYIVMLVATSNSKSINFAKVRVQDGKTMFSVPSGLPISIATSQSGGCGVGQWYDNVAAFFCFSGITHGDSTLVAGYDVNTGSAKWPLVNITCDLPGANGYNTLVNNLLIGTEMCGSSQDLYVVAIDITTGKNQWKTKLADVTGSFFGASPMVAQYQSTVVVSTGTHVFQLDSSSGAIVMQTAAFASSEDGHVAYICNGPENGMVYLARGTFWMNKDEAGVTVVDLK